MHASSHCAGTLLRLRLHATIKCRQHATSGLRRYTCMLGCCCGCICGGCCWGRMCRPSAAASACHCASSWEARTVWGTTSAGRAKEGVSQAAYSSPARTSRPCSAPANRAMSAELVGQHHCDSMLHFTQTLDWCTRPPKHKLKPRFVNPGHSLFLSVMLCKEVQHKHQHSVLVPGLLDKLGKEHAPDDAILSRCWHSAVQTADCTCMAVTRQNT